MNEGQHPFSTSYSSSKEEYQSPPPFGKLLHSQRLHWCLRLHLTAKHLATSFGKTRIRFLSCVNGHSQFDVFNGFLRSAAQPVLGSFRCRVGIAESYLTPKREPPSPDLDLIPCVGVPNDPVARFNHRCSWTLFFRQKRGAAQHSPLGFPLRRVKG